MKELSNLLGFRESIKVVDATLRDGGLVNDFYFTDDFVKALYQANIDAGVDYMEMGYRASKKVFDESKFGKWKFCSDDHIREIVGDNDTDLKLAIMADIKTGIDKTDGKYIEICDRKEAIAYAIDHGQPGDIIVLAGKGHEDYQEIKGVKYPMDERVLIAEILQERADRS